MSGISLRPHQQEAVGKMKNGCILVGGVGSGKSRTSLAYYYICQGGIIGTENYVYMKKPKDLYIITTARKRDELDWEGELAVFLLSTSSEANYYKNNVVVDSWNNIKKYVNVKDAFFIFDEQRVVGSGVWVKSFLKIARQNNWILLSATPGDTWLDYIPVFIANGFYRTRKEFKEKHVVYKPYTKFPSVDRYLNVGRLIRLRNSICIPMGFERATIPHHETVNVNYDIFAYKRIIREKKNLESGKPFKSSSEFCQALRKVVNTADGRQLALLEIFEKHPRMIVFYNYDYELELLKNLAYGVNVEVAEWNGHKHQPIPESDSWVYLVQYNAGAEGWNCIKTDTIVFYSQNYSYKMMIQAAGRIDRLNTPFVDLYYYHLKSKASIDLAIDRALKQKKKFNEGGFAKI